MVPALRFDDLEKNMFDQDLQEYLRVVLDKGFSGHALFLRQHPANRLDAWKLGAEQGKRPRGQFFLGSVPRSPKRLSLESA